MSSGPGSLSRHNHFSEFGESLVTNGGVLSPAARKALAVANLGITASAAELNILDGVTADATEINTLDGITATTAELNQIVVTLDIADGSAEAVYYLVSPHAGAISKIWTVTDGAVATADITITAAIGATPVTNGVVTIATAASAAGDVDSATPTAANVLTAGQAVNFTVTGGGAGGTPRIHLAMVVTR